MGLHTIFEGQKDRGHTSGAMHSLPLAIELLLLNEQSL
jgi:hypothetical protein